MPSIKKSPLLKKLGTKLTEATKQREPVWKGPIVDGVTQSLLGRFLADKERFRLLVIEGIQPQDGFNHRLEYGNLWHVCEEALAAGFDWKGGLNLYCKNLAKQYPTSSSQIEHWYWVCKTQFPIYVRWWQEHPDVKAREPLLQEYVFDVPYKLPSGRVVRLRGKWDSVDVIGKGVWLQENKTKGDIDAGLLRRQLSFDIQVMLYLIALQSEFETPSALGSLMPGIKGVRYNVIRRPCSGGKGSIVRHKPSKSNPTGESLGEYYSRLGKIIEEAIEPDGSHYFFMRWKVEVSQGDIDRFKRECLNPVLEHLCQWYDWVCDCTGDPFGSDRGLHYRLPYGVYNVTLEGGASELDEHLASGSMTGLQRVTELFPELRSE